MVLVMGSDGSLSPSAAQTSFTRTYNDGIGQGSASDGLRIFGEDKDAAENYKFRVAAIAPYGPAPRPDILAAIQDTGLRYSGHPGLRAADITVTDWLKLYRANIEIESAYDPRAVSHAGAIGLGQLMPDTARALGVDPHDWRQNLDGSARYLALMLAEFGDVRLALAAYSAGPDAVRGNGGIPPFQETHSHVQRVLAVFNRLEGASP
ncbi:lytic transglycosylase domain-containing protein [Vannielia litorea]|uniref:lytic transglycosylase domain-containing protein n=1 Tax=Vannielia litorea TaxID=1217970 RepID=UPI001BCC8FAA|nr:lytic transglycosylase domain-containing protein [Vannielia litorea]MBS8224624.1 lytic transglycosylase domain-containing protein [Vannielia litorea]